MTETTVVHSFLAIHAIVVGGILIVLPRITRRGLLFGVYVTEEVAGAASAGRVLRRWDVGCASLVILALAVGWTTSVALRPIEGMAIGVSVLLVGTLALYLWAHRAAWGLVPESASDRAATSVAVVGSHPRRTLAIAKIAIVYCLVLGLAVLGWVVTSSLGGADLSPIMDDPTSSAGRMEALVDLLSVPSLNVAWTPFLAVMGLLTATAKRSVRGGTGGRSVEAQDRFRNLLANTLSVGAMMACTALSFMSLFVLNRAQGTETDFWIPAAIIAGVLMVFLVGSRIWAMSRYGQGGARLEDGSPDAPLTGGLADNRRWILGAFYVNRGDPSIIVEKRFGLGYTLNFGNPTGLAIVGLVLVPLISVMVMKQVFGG